MLTQEQIEKVVNNPSHYTKGAMECIDEMIMVFGSMAVYNFCVCNAWKYRARAQYKGKPEEDLAKANWYLNKAMEVKPFVQRK